MAVSVLGAHTKHIFTCLEEIPDEKTRFQVVNEMYLALSEQSRNRPEVIQEIFSMTGNPTIFQHAKDEWTNDADFMKKIVDMTDDRRIVGYVGERLLFDPGFAQILNRKYYGAKKRSHFLDSCALLEIIEDRKGYKTIKFSELIQDIKDDKLDNNQIIYNLVRYKHRLDFRIQEFHPLAAIRLNEIYRAIPKERERSLEFMFVLVRSPIKKCILNGLLDC